ncbi:hypothetical protein ACFV3R_21065 [Streptomyces sp. NPDC059740]|uniref:hypothetical protein n=1 Tax=Streptomyces sp. NPDC059740 TaxID=3346926 RepID=UPI00364A75A9
MTPNGRSRRAAEAAAGSRTPGIPVPAPPPEPWPSEAVAEGSLGRAVWRLRSRGCWDDAAALLEPFAGRDARAALRRTELLIERCAFTGQGWAAAEDALRQAEALAGDDDERGGAACERGHLAYTATALHVRDRSDEASAALGRAAALLAPTSRGRAALDYRRGLLAEQSASPQSARAAFRRAHAAATTHGDALLLSSTWRHLAGLALAEGEKAEARHGFSESLRLREELGFVVGMAPALVALAEVVPAAEADRLRAEAARLFRLMGGVPTWLGEELPSSPAPAA